MSKNKIRLEICGVECVISSDDSEEYIRTIGAEVSRSINAMRKQNERISVTAAAVFAALNYCDDCRKAQAAADNLRSQIKNYVEDASRARMEADEARREIDRLSRELHTLRARLTAEPSGDAPEQPPVRPARQERAAARQAAQEALSSLPTVTEPDPDAEKGFISFMEKKTDEE